MDTLELKNRLIDLNGSHKNMASYFFGVPELSTDENIIMP